MPLLNGAVLQPSANEVTEPGYPLTYYPGTTDPSTAASIEVQAGTDLTAIDFSLRKQKLFQVRGRILDAVTGKLSTSVRSADHAAKQRQCEFELCGHAAD